METNAFTVWKHIVGACTKSDLSQNKPIWIDQVNTIWGQYYFGIGGYRE